MSVETPAKRLVDSSNTTLELQEEINIDDAITTSTTKLPNCIATTGSEEVSEDGLYRYVLTRRGDVDNLNESSTTMSPCRSLLWIMLNPSSATDKLNDPTMRRCMSFTHDNGFNVFHVVNLFAFRSKDPHVIAQPHKHYPDMTHEDLIGNPRCDAVIEEYALKATAVCCAWGALSTKPLLKRAHTVLLRLKELGVPLLCLEQTKQRQPKQPLYIRKGVVLQPYESMSTISEGGNNNSNSNISDDTTTNVCLTHLDTAF